MMVKLELYLLISTDNSTGTKGQIRERTCEAAPYGNTRVSANRVGLHMELSECIQPHSMSCTFPSSYETVSIYKFIPYIGLG